VVGSPDNANLITSSLVYDVRDVFCMVSTLAVCVMPDMVLVPVCDLNLRML
jgi:hypothetical protein